jgi:hypothetical protein
MDRVSAAATTGCLNKAIFPAKNSTISTNGITNSQRLKPNSSLSITPWVCASAESARKSSCNADLDAACDLDSVP